MTKKERKQYLVNTVKRLAEVEEKIAGKKTKIGYIRLAIFIIGLVLFLAAFFYISNVVSLTILALFLILFILVSSWQNKIIAYHKVILKAIAVKKSYLARIELDWKNIDYKKTENIEPLMDLEIDIDLCGPQSLHHLIDFSKSVEGSLYLRKLLSRHELNKEEIISRQKIVDELSRMNRFCDRFLITSELVSNKDLNNRQILDWLKTGSEDKSVKSVLVILALIMLVNWLFVGLDLFGIAPGLWVFSYFVYIVLYFLSNSRIKNLARDSDFLKEELSKYSKILELIEQYDFGKNENVKLLCEPLRVKGKSPSRKLKRITDIVNMLTFRVNPFVWGFFIVVGPIDYLLAYLVETAKKEIAEQLPVWLNVWNKLEAYVSLGTFTYLNPEYNFPDIVNDRFEFRGENIGHVLIPYEKKVCNDFKFNETGDIYIITGSNMSGKSTFLRTLGVNVALAYAGGPVNADNFTLSLLNLFTCIKVSDSVIDGISYFYAEVKRLKQLLNLLDAYNNYPVMFFIDEIFKGTNNIERRIGSRSYLKSLVGRNAVGIVSTHDIELAKLDESNAQITNLHFREEINNDKMVFDYKLREGACPTTNALKIMSLEGLPVDKN